MPRCRQALRKARTLPSAPRTTAIAAAHARSRRSAVPSIGSWRQARARPPGRYPSCRWRYGRAPVAPQTGRPLPLSFLPSLSGFHPSIRLPPPETKETAACWDEPRSTVLGELAAQPALETAQGGIGRLLRAVHQPVAARGMTHRNGTADDAQPLALGEQGGKPKRHARPAFRELQRRFEAVDPDGLL